MFFLGRLIIRSILLPILRILYRLRRLCAYKIPKYGGALLLPNHVSYMDSFLVDVISPRRMRFLTLDKYAANPLCGWFLATFRAIPIDRTKARDAIDKIAEALKKGDVVCVYPEGGMTRSGAINELKRGPELMSRRSGAPVVPVYIDGMWGSVYSYEGGRFFKKFPKSLFRPTQVAYGDPIEADEISTERIFEGMLAASVDAFSSRRCFEKNLETAVISALKKGRNKNFTFEYAKEPRRWSRSEFLGIAMAIARRWINSPPDKRQRIGILLPPGPTPAVINLGLFLAGKTPVSLPFNLRAEQVENLAQKMEALGIRTVITSKAFMPHLIDFWRGEEGRFIDIQSELTAPGSLSLSQERLFGKIEPRWLTKWRLEIKQRDCHREAVGFIESPDKEPVFLTSNELHRNALQVASGDFVRKGDTILSEYEMNSVVGQLMNLWVPLLNEGRAVCRSYSKRDDSQLLKAMVEGQNVNVMVGDLAFYREINKEQDFDLPDLRIGMIFDEKAEWNDIETFESELNIPMAPCWNFSGRIVTMSLPKEQNPPEGSIELMDRKPGSVGRFLPGIAGRRQDGKFYIRFDSTAVSKSENDRDRKVSEAEENWLLVSETAHLDKQGFLVLKADS